MKKLNPPRKHQPRPPTLRLDHHQAWRQSENAIIIPIVYDFIDPAREEARRNALIIPIVRPEPIAAAEPIALFQPASSPPLNLAASAGIADEIAPRPARQLKPLTTHEYEPGLAARSTLAVAQAHPDSLFFVPSGSAFSRTHHLSTAVPLLLLCGIALVFFAWMAFR